MKNINYILNSDFVDIDSMISKKRYLREVTVLAAIPVAVFGIVILSGMLPVAVAIDTERYIKLQCIYISKKHHQRKYIRDVLSSLSLSKDKINKIAYRFRNIDNLSAMTLRHPATYNNLSREFRRFNV